MGLYIRKSFRLFGGTRLNVSKSGLGISTGIPGFRVGTGPRGNYVHMGRGGVYYRQSLGGRQSGASPSPVRDTSVSESAIVDSGPTTGMVDESAADILRELNTKHNAFSMVGFALVLSFILIVFAATQGRVPLIVALVIATLICIVFAIVDVPRRTTVMVYNMDEDSTVGYGVLQSAVGAIADCARVWNVDRRAAVTDGKYHAGAAGIVARKSVTPSFGRPRRIYTNVNVPLLPAGAQTLAFMPDRLLVFDAAGVGAISYSDLVVETNEDPFIESEFVPSDAHVTGHTWQYVNKDGGPDRRFAGNREIPICAYTALRLTSASGLNEHFMLSKRGAADPLVNAIRMFREADASALQSPPRG